jgi:hypothetical protein
MSAWSAQEEQYHRDLDSLGSSQELKADEIFPPVDVYRSDEVNPSHFYLCATAEQHSTRESVAFPVFGL